MRQFFFFLKKCKPEEHSGARGLRTCAITWPVCCNFAFQSDVYISPDASARQFPSRKNSSFMGTTGCFQMTSLHRVFAAACVRVFWHLYFTDVLVNHASFNIPSIWRQSLSTRDRLLFCCFLRVE